MENLKDFTGLYPLSKTLRFELKPIRKTLENIQSSGLLERDQHRAESYKKVKKIIDDYHKSFIDRTLTNFKLKLISDSKKDSLEEYYLFYHLNYKDINRSKSLTEVQDKLRKQIADQLTKNEAYKRIYKKELIKEDLCNFINSENYLYILKHRESNNDELTEEQFLNLRNQDKELVNEFKDFTTYFTGFNQNRQNMYSAENKSTAIAYRLIHQNLPRFIDNMDVFEKVSATNVSEKINSLYDDLKEYLNVQSLAEMFKLSYYSILLTQNQIDVYNAVIGGKTLDDGTKIQGLNEHINLYNQQQKDKKYLLPKLKPLYKQILSDRNAISWLPEEFNDDNEMLQAIDKCYHELNQQVFQQLKDLLLSLKEGDSEYNMDKIYIRNDAQLSEISQRLLGNWNIISRAIENDFSKNNPQKIRESADNYEKRKDKYLKSFGSLSLGYINNCLSLLGDPYNKYKVEDYFFTLGIKKEDSNKCDNLFTKESKAYEVVKDLLCNKYPEDKNLAQQKKDVEHIKNLLDSIKDIQHFIQPLLGTGDEPNKDEKFYGDFLAICDKLDEITPLYNKVRNRMTRKPYSIEKIKINFDNSTLLDGWDLNKEIDNTSVILRKDGLYYLAIMNKKYNKVFNASNLPCDGSCYEKMDYKLLPGPNKMLPKVFIYSSRISEFNPSERILDNYQKGTHKKGDNFNLDDCHALIDYFKRSIAKHEDWRNFDFHFSDTNTYKDISGFYREVEQQGYKISFRNISETYINALVDEGKLYLFQIYNKDFSPYSQGTPNMHTLYWRMLFDAKNLENVVYKLNGQAEVFFRKSSINETDKIVHPAQQPINNKNELNEKRQSVFNYELVKDRRFTVDKFQFHVPITLNFKSIGMNNINSTVNSYLKDSKVTHIIGIDRGERNLLYLSLIDMKGNIVKQISLNEIVNQHKDNLYQTDYHSLLESKEVSRDEARKSWKAIENIKELKEGYLSQVIHKISQLVVEYNAIVVLENLNFVFMRGRQKVERQVYEKFEKMLIDKFNYLVDKKAAKSEPGGLLQALQLTSKFDSFQNLGKQSGILFYIPAWNTSKMDPETGFVNLFDVHYESIEKSKTFFKKFDSIRYNALKGYFEIAFDYTNFTSKAEGTRSNWVVCTYGSRIKTFRNPEQNSNWDSVEIDLTSEFKTFFDKYHIELNDKIKEQVIKQNDKTFFEGFHQLFKLTLQMRNSKTGSDIDYMISPVMGENGKFFDSRLELKQGKNTEGYWISSMPVDADANGAYNIARKGLWVINQIKSTDDLDKLNLAISNKEWLKYAQTKPYLNND